MNTEVGVKFGLNTVLWTWPFSGKRIELLQKIKSFGYDAAEIAVEDMSERNVARIEAGFRDNGLDCVLCGVFSPDRCIMSESAGVRRSGLDYFRKLIDLACRLGASLVVGPAYSVGIHPELLDREKRRAAWERCKGSLRRAGEYASDRNVRIAIEPLNRYESNFVNTAEEAIKLVKAVHSPSVGVQLDIYHMNIEEKSPSAAIEMVNTKLFHLHVPEHDRGTPGTGHTDWTAVAASVKKIGFEGYAVIESCHPSVKEIAAAAAIWRKYDRSQDELAKTGLRFLRTIMG
jgi:D-psicose/D-tagatose/L-ribulose 3-epimerase